MSVTISTALRNICSDGVETLLKLGSAVANPTMVYLAGATVLKSVALSASDPCVASSGGVVVLNPPNGEASWVNQTPTAAGTCDKIELRDRDEGVVITLTGANMGLPVPALTTDTPIIYTAPPQFTMPASV